MKPSMLSMKQRMLSVLRVLFNFKIFKDKKY
jgi:hypothetical protein